MQTGYEGCHGGEGALHAGLVELAAHADSEFGFHGWMVKKMDLRNETVLVGHSSPNALRTDIDLGGLEFAVCLISGVGHLSLLAS